jgi:hypothetical protein
VLIQGPISPDNLFLVGSHRWLPADETQLATWKLAQVLTDHPAINALLPKSGLTHLCEKYCFDVIQQAVKDGKLPLEDDTMLLCLDRGKAKDALKELLEMLPSETCRSWPQQVTSITLLLDWTVLNGSSSICMGSMIPCAFWYLMNPFKKSTSCSS